MFDWKPNNVRIDHKAEKSLNSYFQQLKNILEKNQVHPSKQADVLRDLKGIILEYLEEEQLDTITYEVSLKILDLLGSPSEFMEVITTDIRKIAESYSECLSCKRQIEPGSSFCHHCGEKEDIRQKSSSIVWVKNHRLFIALIPLTYLEAITSVIILLLTYLRPSLMSLFGIMDYSNLSQLMYMLLYIEIILFSIISTIALFSFYSRRKLFFSDIFLGGICYISFGSDLLFFILSLRVLPNLHPIEVLLFLGLKILIILLFPVLLFFIYEFLISQMEKQYITVSERIMFLLKFLSSLLVIESISISLSIFLYSIDGAIWIIFSGTSLILGGLCAIYISLPFWAPFKHYSHHLLNCPCCRELLDIKFSFCMSCGFNYSESLQTTQGIKKWLKDHLTFISLIIPTFITMISLHIIRPVINQPNFYSTGMLPLLMSITMIGGISAVKGHRISKNKGNQSDLFLSGMLFIIYGIGLFFFYIPTFNLVFMILAPVLIFLFYKLISPTQRKVMQLTSLTSEQNKLGILSYLLSLASSFLFLLFMCLQLSFTFYGPGSEDDVFTLFGALLLLPGYFGAITISLTLGVGAVAMSLYDLRKTQEFKFSIPMAAFVSILGLIFIIIGIINEVMFFYTITVAACLGGVTLGVTIFIDSFNNQKERLVCEPKKTINTKNLS